MSGHICTVCFQPSDRHDERCIYCVRVHWPPLCCKGCDCKSFEHQHLLSTHSSKDGESK